MKQKRKVKGQRKRGGTFLEEGNWEKENNNETFPSQVSEVSYSLFVLSSGVTDGV